LYITGHLEEVFDAEHRKEMIRYIYCHQVYFKMTNYTVWISMSNFD